LQSVTHIETETDTTRYIDIEMIAAKTHWN